MSRKSTSTTSLTEGEIIQLASSLSEDADLLRERKKFSDLLRLPRCYAEHILENYDHGKGTAYKTICELLHLFQQEWGSNATLDSVYTVLEKMRLQSTLENLQHAMEKNQINISQSALTTDNKARFDVYVKNEALSTKNVHEFVEFWKTQKNSMNEVELVKYSLLPYKAVSILLSPPTNESQVESAMKFCSENLDIYKKLGRNNRAFLRLQVAKAYILCQLIKYDEALEISKSVYEIQSTELPKDHLDILETQHILAQCLWATGKQLQALALTKEVLEGERKKGKDTEATLSTFPAYKIIIQEATEFNIL